MFRRWFVRIGPALGLIAIVLVFSLITDAPGRYLSAFNLRIVMPIAPIAVITVCDRTIRRLNDER